MYNGSVFPGKYKVATIPGHPWNAKAFGPARGVEFWKAPKYVV